MTLSNERTDAVALLDEAIATTRTLSHAISGPSDGTRLRDSLESLSHHFSARYHVTFQFEDLAGNTPEPSAIVRDEAYAALRELLFNVVKHAGVESARVSLGADDRGGLLISVSDRGRGFVNGAEGLGLPSVRARLAAVGAELMLRSPTHGGTTATIRLPPSESPLAAAS